MKKRKFNSGGDIDAEEAQYKAAGLAASNAENKKPSGFFGRLSEGNIDEKGSEAYNKYGAGYGRKLEADKTAQEAKAKDEANYERIKKFTAENNQATAKVAAAPTNPEKNSDNSFNDLESKRFASPRSTLSPGVTRVTENMPTTRPVGGGQVTTGDANVADYANRFPSSTTPEKGDGGGRDTSRFKKAAAAPVKAVKAPAATSSNGGGGRRGGLATATPSANAYGKEQQYQRAQEAETSPAAKERRKEKEKSQALEASRPELDIAGGMAGASLKTLAKIAKNLANRGGAKTAAKRLERPDPTYTKKELELIKEVPRELSGRAKQLALPSPTKRIGYDKPMEKGGMVSKYASGGAVSSRADGIAQRGKTRCKVC